MLKSIFKREISKQFLRFCLVGLESTILNYLVFLIMVYFISINYTLSYITGFIVGTFFGYFFNKVWSFESKNKYSKEIINYFLFYVASLIIGTFLIRILVNSFNINPLVANIPVIGITTIMNFFGTKIFAFKNKKW